MGEIKNTNLGIVVIGRNEGSRLHRCLQSLIDFQGMIVYVDSASNDNSVEIAHSFGVDVVEIKEGVLLTAARGRNSGFERLQKIDPSVSYVQFVDGDTDILPGWLTAAVEYLENHREIALVAGKLEEKDSHMSIYKRLCAMEWHMLPGEVKATGGNFMVRSSVFKEIGGFNQEIIGAEDNELCYRVRLKGWKIMMLDVPMAVHDTFILTFWDFFQRSMRSGYGFSHVSSLHHGSPESLFVKENRSTIFFGGILPIVALGFSIMTSGLSLALFGFYPWIYWRIYKDAKPRWGSDAHLYAMGCILAKFPGFLGTCKFYLSHLRSICNRRF